MSYIFKKRLVDTDSIKKKKPNYIEPAYQVKNTAEFITLHETDNPSFGADANAHASLQISGYSDAWHYQGDDKQVIQSWDESVSCYHAGDGTSNNGLGSKTSVAYELCVNEGIDIAKSRAVAEEFFADWLFARKRGVDRIKTHKDWSGKNCPQKIIDEGYFPTFKVNVQKHLDKLNNKTSLGDETVAAGQIVRAQNALIPIGTYNAYLKLAAAFKKATGYDLLITDAYRTYAQQKSLYDRWKAGTFSAPSVAYPGTSLHETGRALDIRDSGSTPGVTVAGNVRSNWIRNNAAKYGFNPAGYGFREPWHVEYTGDPWKATGHGSSTGTSTGTSTTPSVNAGFSISYIKDVQQRLIAKGYSVGSSGADGYRGPDTVAAIKKFQKDNGLTVDGLPGPVTLAKLKATPTPSTGAKTKAIKAVQAAVRATQDGISGPDTKKRVDAVRQSSAWGGRKFPNGVKYTQSVVGANQDNSWGPASTAAHDRTVKAIQAAVGVTQDAQWGPTTDKAVRSIIG